MANSIVEKSSQQQIAEAQAAVQTQKDREAMILIRRVQLSLTTAKTQVSARLQNVKYAAAGFSGSPIKNLIKDAQELDALLEIEHAPINSVQ